MRLITDHYRQLNIDKHAASSSYGTVGHVYSNEIVDLTRKLETTDILDYGCGKSTLANSLPFQIKQYDPCIAKYQADPEPADIVVCTDVMEHIEPECLDDVLAHIKSKTKKIFYCSINTIPAAKHLADGRNAHLICENMGFWATKLEQHFLIISIVRRGPDLMVIAEPLEDGEKNNVE